MVRRSLSTPPDDPVYTDVPDEDILREQVLNPDPDRHGPDVERTGDGCTRKPSGTSGERQHGEANPGPSAERPATHCATCGKPLEATLTCPACGDPEEMAA